VANYFPPRSKQNDWLFFFFFFFFFFLKKINIVYPNNNFLINCLFICTQIFLKIAIRGGALLRAEFMGYQSRCYPDSMANLYYSNNFYNNVFFKRGCFRSQLSGIHQMIKGTIAIGTISRAIASDM
jgi:hypothetical protein